MSTELGDVLPEKLRGFLADPTDPANGRQVLVATTLDPDGWPRHALLSPREVVARGPSRLLALLYEDSRSSRNLRRDGRLSLVVVNPEMSYYVFASASQRPGLAEAPHESLFELRVERVVEDVLETARIVTGLTYEGHDPGAPPEERQAVWRRLVSC
jgi:hypothetical protein